MDQLKENVREEMAMVNGAHLEYIVLKELISSEHSLLQSVDLLFYLFICHFTIDLNFGKH